MKTYDYMHKGLKRLVMGFLPFYLFTSLFFQSCDSYIDITPKGKITVDSVSQFYQLIVDPLRSYYPSSFIFLSDNQWALESDIIGKEWVSHDAINFTFNEAADRTMVGDNNLYENMYKNILRSNLIIDNIDDAVGDPSLKMLAKAEARVFRAFDHFLAVNTYAKAYNPATAASDGGVCIVDHYDLESTPSKHTVAEVYNFIISELEESVAQLQEKPVNIYHPNKAFGYALLAKVYLFHCDWAKAKAAAEASFALNSTLVDYNVIKNAGGLSQKTDYAKDGNPEVLSYHWMSGWGGAEEVCLLHYGMLSPELKNLFESNDLRYSIFFRIEPSSMIGYFDYGSGAPIWLRANNNIDRFTYMSVGLRTAEVYLMLAEANARLGDLSTATGYVNQLRAKRLSGSSAIPTPATQKDMMDQIILERRKELLFGFNRFFDLKRFNQESDYQTTVVRQFPLVNITPEHPQQTYTLRPNSPLYVIPFPRTATDRNPNLTQNTNN